MKYSHFLFDADNTLFDFYKAEAYALEKTFSAYNIPFEATYLALYSQVNKAFWQAFEEKRITAAALKLGRFETFFEQAGLRGLEARDFSEHYLEALAEGSQLMEGAEELVTYLAQRAKVFIITNGLSRVQRKRVGGSSLHPHIQDLIISEEVGAAKPDPRIFDIAFERMNHPQKEQVLLVGDNPLADIQGALDYGIDACWFRARALSTHHPNATYTIDNLAELYQYL